MTKKTNLNQVSEATATHEQLVLTNLAFARWTARQFVGRGLDLEDLEQASVLGLMRAAEKFDPNRGTRFITYAAWWCRQSIVRAIEREARTIRVPAYVHLALGQRARAEAQGEELPPPSQFEAAGRLAQRVTSLDAAVTNAHWNEPADGYPDPGTLAAIHDMHRTLRSRLACLPDRLREVVTRRFGIDCEKESLAKVGDRLNISGTRVRELERRALELLRDQLTVLDKSA